MIPSETTPRSTCASDRSTGSDTATKSPNDDFGSQSRARTYADATDERSPPRDHRSTITSSMSPAIAAPAGETCLNVVATAADKTPAASRTSCQAPRASSTLMYDGSPDTTRMGQSGASNDARAVCSGFSPYLNSMESSSTNRRGPR